MLKMRLQLYRNPQMDQSCSENELEPVEMGSPFVLDTYAIDGRTPLMTSVCNCDHRIAELVILYHKIFLCKRNIFAILEFCLKMARILIFHEP
jgi:hypothetical protein